MDRYSLLVHGSSKNWKNYKTWNVAFRINFDETLYEAAKAFFRNRPSSEAPYLDFIIDMGLVGKRTPAGFEWDDADLDLAALDEMMRELAEEI